MFTKRTLIFLIGIFFLFTIQSAFAQKEGQVIKRATRYYEDRKGLADKVLPDWVVEFEVPSDSRAHVVSADGDDEKKIVSKSLVTPKKRGDKLIIEIKTGWLARRGYKGNIGQWARSLYVRYLVKFEPRGKPNKPRGR